MSSDEGVLVCQSCNESAAGLRVAVVAPQAIVGAVRAVPPQKGPVLLLFRLIIIMGRVGALPEVDACGSVESALSLAAAPTNLTPSRRRRVDGVSRELSPATPSPRA